MKYCKHFQARDIVNNDDDNKELNNNNNNYDNFSVIKNEIFYVVPSLSCFYVLPKNEL